VLAVFVEKRCTTETQRTQRFSLCFTEINLCELRAFVVNKSQNRSSRSSCQREGCNGASPSGVLQERRKRPNSPVPLSLSKGDYISENQ